MKATILILGILATLLGGLWLAQGLGLITIKPILCVANCEPIEEPSPTWAIIGAVLAAAGLTAIYFAVRRGRAA